MTLNNTAHKFSIAVKHAVDNYFKNGNLKKSGDLRLYTKSLLFISLAIIIYFFLLFGAYSNLIGFTMCILFGFTLSLIAINTMHDACHGSYSDKKWINATMGLTMNLLGSNAFLWKIKHNILHHTYTNIDGKDNDISHWPLLRQSPVQKWKPWHRYQYLYILPLYALSTIEWILFADFKKYFSRKLSAMIIDRISLQEHILFWISKTIYIILFIITPSWLLGWEVWMTGFIIFHFTMGLTLTMIFQLGHLVCNTRFESAEKVLKHINEEWAAHEVMTTSNFAIDNKVINWLAGGLNFQIEHHLCPNVSHIHYPAIAKLIRNECVKHQLPYHCYPTLKDAIFSHFRFMKRLGENNLY